MVIALAGRRIDAPETTPPGFPAANIQQVRTQLKAFLSSNNAGTIVCSAACGADLIALELAGGLGMHRVVVIPFSPEIFRETSVTDRPGNWGEVYDKVLNEVKPIVLNYDTEDNDAYTNTNLVILDLAEQLAKDNGPAEALIVWNSKPRDTFDTSFHFKQEAMSRNIPVKEISTLALAEEDFLAGLKEKLKIFDRAGAEEIGRELITHIYQSEDAIDKKSAGRIMHELRRRRMFDLMQQVGDAYIFTGKATWTIKKLYAQALIDENILSAARSFVLELIADSAKPGNDKEARAENMEAHGLLGRLYKQQYINSGKTTKSHAQQVLVNAIQAYYDVYKQDTETCTWHGINAAALLTRAEADGVTVAGFPEPKTLAREILNTIEEKEANGKANVWDFATAAEACIALNDAKNALEWISGYTGSPFVDAFELNSTLRQLKEVWRIDMSSEIGKLILPVLHAVLMKQEGGMLKPGAGESKELADNIQKTYENLVSPAVNNNQDGHLEKAFGADTFSSVKSYKDGLYRSALVGRISRRNRSMGDGTGFILPGKHINEIWTDELVLITNAHIINNDPLQGALLPEDAEIIFEELDEAEKFYVDKIIWMAPYTKSDAPVFGLDTSIVTFTAESLSRLKKLTENIPVYPIAPRLPWPNEKDPPLIYIIGYPGGGSLQYSMKNNVLIDRQDPRIHYRTATLGGSSGSPVFNEIWELVGLHHAGSRVMPRLNGRQGTYEANEGIWINAIKAKML